MFAYCLNNPVCRKDILGATSVDIFDDDVDHTDDDKEFSGGKTGGGNGEGAGNPSPNGGNGGGKSFNLNGQKGPNYIKKRGWTLKDIKKAIQNGKTGESINKATGNPCSVYSHPGVQYHYIVIDNITGSVVQASNIHDSSWRPDTCIRFY